MTFFTQTSQEKISFVAQQHMLTGSSDLSRCKQRTFARSGDLYHVQLADKNEGQNKAHNIKFMSVSSLSLFRCSTWTDNSPQQFLSIKNAQ